MTILRALATLIACTLILAIIGGGAGLLLGRYAPGYYRGALHQTRDPEFNPSRVGLGRGVVQGAVGGVVAGLAVIALLSWRDVRLARTGQMRVDQPESTARAAGIALLISGALLTLIVFTVGGVIVGAFAGESGAYQRRFLEERDAVAPLVGANPTFSGLRIEERSDGGIFVYGSVPRQADLEQLRAAVTRAVGERRGKELLYGVDVGP